MHMQWVANDHTCQGSQIVQSLPASSEQSPWMKKPQTWNLTASSSSTILPGLTYSYAMEAETQPWQWMSCRVSPMILYLHLEDWKHAMALRLRCSEAAAYTWHMHCTWHDAWHVIAEFVDISRDIPHLAFARAMELLSWKLLKKRS